MDPLEVVMRAAYFATQKHSEQRRKNQANSPYINHPLEVANLLTEAGVDDPAIIAAALLHDTIEDTDTTYEELNERFGRRIADIVLECTDDKSLGLYCTILYSRHKQESGIST